MNTIYNTLEYTVMMTYGKGIKMMTCRLSRVMNCYMLNCSKNSSILAHNCILGTINTSDFMFVGHASVSRIVTQVTRRSPQGACGRLGTRLSSASGSSASSKKKAVCWKCFDKFCTVKTAVKGRLILTFHRLLLLCIQGMWLLIMC